MTICNPSTCNEIRAPGMTMCNPSTCNEIRASGMTIYVIPLHVMKSELQV